MDTIGGLLKWNMSQSTLQKTSGFIGLRVDFVMETNSFSAGIWAREVMFCTGS